MPDNKFFYEDPDSQYGEGVMLDEYNGKWSLVSARQGKDGTVYMQWAYPQARDGTKKPIEKSVPWKVSFGSKEATISGLRHFLEILEEGAPF